MAGYAVIGPAPIVGEGSGVRERAGIARLVALILGVSALLAFAHESLARDALRVCADPNNLPFSNRDGAGFENRLANILARELDLPVEYTWFPQRRGFTRNTLRAKVQGGGYKCDLIMGVPASFELGIPTKPYYRSSYALVYVKGRGLDGVQSGQDFMNLKPNVRDRLRVGVFAGTAGSLWLAQNGMHKQMVALPAMEADPDAYPGRIVENDLARGDLDAVVIWGPIAGYFAKKSAAEMAVIPLASGPGLKFDFAISSAVRYGEGEWKDEIEAIYTARHDEVNALLAEYGVPLLPIGEVAGRDDDDD